LVLKLAAHVRGATARRREGRMMRRGILMASAIAFAIAGCGGSDVGACGAEGLACCADSSCEGALTCATGTCVGGSKVPVVTQFRTDALAKVDLLLAIDNSSSMSDKSDELARRLPELIATLTDRAGGGRVLDLHIAVVSSSLGTHGTRLCDPKLYGGHQDDRGRLLPRAGEAPSSGYVLDPKSGVPVATACPTSIESSAISWTYEPSTADHVGAAQVPTVETSTSCVVRGAGGDGCGYEAQLESLYHFLIDPAPYLTAELTCTHGPNADDCGGRMLAPDGLDDIVLRQRAAFLRPDSVLAVELLTDENDFSLSPIGLNWLPLAFAAGTMPRGFAGCADVPDDFEALTQADLQRERSDYGCDSCARGADPLGRCAIAWGAPAPNLDTDQLNVRGFHQLQRYGYDFLWPRQRYVDAFTLARVPGSDGRLGDNPIFAGGRRTRDMIVVSGILGAPPKLLANPDGSAKLHLTESDWDLLTSPDLKRRDPHMLESIAPRTAAGIRPYAGDRSVDPVNGGDREIPTGDDLQYACIGPRADAAPTVDCQSLDATTTNPLCALRDGQPTQPFLKAYPTLRELRVLHALQTRGVVTVVGSICSPSYAPAVRAFGRAIGDALASPAVHCLPTAPAVDEGATECAVFEVFADAAPSGVPRCEALAAGAVAYCTPGASPCRIAGHALAPTSASSAVGSLVTSVAVGTRREEVAPLVDADGNVYARGSDGVRHLVCEVAPIVGNPVFEGEKQDACLHDAALAPPPGAGGGWCVSDDPLATGACGAHGLRVVGDAKTRAGSVLVAVCLPAK
jgi:hypothetical protein